jgi:hypothetical protein
MFAVNSNSTTETSDHIEEAVVILFGRLAKHLDASDFFIPSIPVDVLRTIFVRRLRIVPGNIRFTSASRLQAT